MRSISVVLLTLGVVLVLAAAATAQVQCVPVSPAEPTETTVVPSQPTTVMSVPAGFGAGPVNQLAVIPRSPLFDRSYAETMFQAHSEVAALANIGAQKASDESIRNLSRKMVDERVDLNQKLSNWYGSNIGGGVLAVDELAVTSLRDPLASLTGSEFDQAYSAAMLAALGQEIRIANEGTFKASDKPLHDISNLEHRTAYNEARAFQNWRIEGVLEK